MNENVPLLLKALEFAARKHSGQRRKGADAAPYINHPVAVANILCNEGGVTDAGVLAAALLHDTIEDTGTSREELERLFGPDVARIVAEVSDDKSLPKEERKRLQIEHAAHVSREAKLVKLADKIANLREIVRDPPADWSAERRREYFEWAKAVVDRLRGTHECLERLFDQAYELNPAESQSISVGRDGRKITARVMKMMHIAEQEAKRRNQNLLRTEHLLYGILKLESCEALDIFKKFGVDMRILESDVESALSVGGRIAAASGLDYSPNVKQVFDKAWDAAAGRMQQDFISTAEILIGILEDGEGAAAQILKKFKIDSDGVAQTVHELYKDHSRGVQS